MITFGKYKGRLLEDGYALEQKNREWVRKNCSTNEKGYWIKPDTPMSEREFTFGRYKGRTVGQVKEIDRGYLEWLASDESTYMGRFHLKKFLEEDAAMSLEVPPSTDNIQEILK
jgi:uncharacterized protein (DUF3820 family)